MITTEKTKRVRSTKTRDKRWIQFMSEITASWAHAVRTQQPLHATFARLSDQIRALDIVESYREDLRVRNWGARDLVVCLHAEWCLYLDGKRTTSSEAFELGRHNDLCGRFEWRGTGKPFYDNQEPELLRSK